MSGDRGLFVPGYFVTVEVRSRAPKLWGWALWKEGSDAAHSRSANLFRHAEDAWRAGQAELGKVAEEATRAPRRRLILRR